MEAWTSVTRFGEISPLGKFVKILWQNLEGLFSIWQNIEHKLVNFWAVVVAQLV